MEILILSCGTGGGHNMAGQALQEELCRRGHAVSFEDVYLLVGEKASAFVNNGYIKFVQRTPRLFGVVYFLAEGYRKLPFHSPVYYINGKFADRLERYLSQHHFDVLIMTHTFAAHMVANLQARGVPLPKTVLVATDYTCTPFMEESDCDLYVIPSDVLRSEFISRGIAEDRIQPFGIPVRRGFFTHEPQAEVRRKLGLQKDQFYILLSGGSIGASCISASMKVLTAFLKENDRSHLIVVCGNNHRLYEKLSRRYGAHTQISILNRTSQMADYMKACDLFISKPGGLSSTEAAAAGVPLIHIAPIPGCESHNIRYFEERNMSIAVRNPRKELLSAVGILQNTDVVNEMKQAQQNHINGLSTVDLCDFIEQSNL